MQMVSSNVDQLKACRFETTWNEIEKNLQLRDQQISSLYIRRNKLIVDGKTFKIKDYGSSYANDLTWWTKIWRQFMGFSNTGNFDFNLCFYLCILEGNGKEAKKLKKRLALCVRKLDDNTEDHHCVGTMANSDVIHTFCLEYNVTLYIVDESSRKVLSIKPKNKPSEVTIYLLRRNCNHYQRLYPV